MNKSNLVIILIFFYSISFCNAQISTDKMNEYLHTSKFALDTQASSIVLYESIKIDISLEPTGFMEKKSVKRILKIISKDALDQADIMVKFADNNLNYIQQIKGTTYNLDGNKVVTTDLSKNNYFSDRSKKAYDEVRFTLPDVREGSIIEYSYIVVTPFYYVLPIWHIQEDQPKLFSEYSISYLDRFAFTSIIHAKPAMKTCKTFEEALKSKEDFCFYADNNYTGVAGVNYSYWIRRNITATKEEPFVLNFENYKERLELQLVKFNLLTNSPPFLNTWDKYNKMMWESKLVASTRKNNAFLEEPMNEILKGETDKLSIAKAIFNYIRKNIRINEIDDAKEFEVKSIFNKKEGNSAQVNALLVAMLNYAGLDAYMLATGTTHTISAIPQYPVENRLIYYACALAMDNGYILLDASDKSNIFGTLPPSCYNGYSRVISKAGDGVQLTTNLLEDRNIFFMKITFPDDTMKRCEIVQKIGLVSSSLYRKQIEKNGTDVNVVLDNFMSKFGDNINILDKKLENLDNPDTNLIIKVVYTEKMDGSGSSYFFNASQKKLFEKNPFIASTRELPIEYQCRVKYGAFLNVILPKNYVIDSVPPPLEMTLGDSSMEYKKTINYNKESNILTVNTSYKNNQVVYKSEDYNIIREFYESVIKDENEVLEIKKK